MVPDTPTKTPAPRARRSAATPSKTAASKRARRAESPPPVPSAGFREAAMTARQVSSVAVRPSPSVFRREEFPANLFLGGNSPALRD